MAASSDAIPQVALSGELIKGKKGGGKKTTAAKDLAHISDDQWRRLLGNISQGVALGSAISTTRITRYELDAFLRADPKKKAQWEDAKLAALRMSWDVDTIEEALVHIAMGCTIKQACENVFREDDINSFYRLVLKDPVIRELYDEARIIQAEKMAIDDLIEIADEEGNDETWDGKGNSAAVNRSRLKVDTRKWIAARLHSKRFGDKIQQDINANLVVDHASRLEAARKRKERAAKGDEE